MSAPKYSIVIPVYNRPEELSELLESLTHQSYKDFEVLIVDDGSEKTSKEVYEKYSSQLKARYFFKQNSGPGPSRNLGFENSLGQFFVVFDSDCILPPGYFEAVEKFVTTQKVDAWGGPDKGHENFTPLQRAMAYTMSSVMTTGGIRGANNQAATFQPRSFNMGISRQVFEKVGGFHFDRLAEDIELSVRIRNAGFRVGLISDAFVFHKRRTDLSQFFSQVEGFGRGRVRVGKKFPGEIKVTHWFPSFFLMALVALPVVAWLVPILGWLGLMGLIGYSIVIFIDAMTVTNSFEVAIRSVPSAFVQLTGYGYGFLSEMFSGKSQGNVRK